MSYKAISNVFEEYRKARMSFVYDICEFASWQSSVKYLDATDVIELLAPLIGERIIKIKKRAIIAAGRLAEKSERLTKKMMTNNSYVSLFKDVYNSDISVRKAIIYFIKGISRHNAEITTEIVEFKVIPDLVLSLEDFDIEIKRDAVSALGNIGKHNKTLAKVVIESGALPLLISCYLQPDIGLQQNVMKVFEELCQYYPQDIIAVGALTHIVKALTNTDMKLKIVALKTLALIADASEELAQSVVESGVLNIIMSSAVIQSAFVIRNIVKHSAELAQKVVNEGACELLVQLLTLKETVISSSNTSATNLLSTDVNQTKSSLSNYSIKKHNLTELNYVDGNFNKRSSCISLGCKMMQQNAKCSIAPVVEAFGFIAAQSPKLALDVILSKAVVPIVKIICDSVRSNKNSVIFLENSEQLSTLCSCVWALGQISQHSPEHSESVAAAGTLPLLVQLWQNNMGIEELQKQIEKSFSLCLKHCLYKPALEPLLHVAPSQLLHPVLSQYAKILPYDAKARRLFITTGALQKIQELSKQSNSEMAKLISNINLCFPEEILKYCSPDFVNTLLEHVDKYTPQVEKSPEGNKD